MRFARYVGVQIVAYGVDMGLFLVFFALAGQGAVTANVAAKVVAGLFAFLAHRYITFEAARKGKQARQAVLYLALWLLNVPLSTGLLALLLLPGIAAVIAKVVADVVCVGLNYWVSRNFIFVGRQDSNRRFRTPAVTRAGDGGNGGGREDQPLKSRGAQTTFNELPRRKRGRRSAPVRLWPSR